MKLNKNSWHYKLWDDSFDAYTSRPVSTDLCRYCHRVFWQLMFWAFVSVCGIGLLWAFVYGGIYQGLIRHTLLTLTIIGITGTVIGVFALYTWWINRDRSYREPTTLVGKYVQASKNKVCPMVEFSDSEEK